jgi:hypothetical protein
VRKKEKVSGAHPTVFKQKLQSLAKQNSHFIKVLWCGFGQADFQSNQPNIFDFNLTRNTFLNRIKVES